RGQQSTNIPGGSGALGGAQAAGVGAAVDAELLGSNTDAYISNSSVHAGSNVEVSALTREQVLSATAGLGIGGGAGLAGGASDVHLTGSTQAYINDGSTIDTTGNLSVTANDEAN